MISRKMHSSLVVRFTPIDGHLLRVIAPKTIYMTIE
jgi:hypothetical protein